VKVARRDREPRLEAPVEVTILSRQYMFNTLRPFDSGPFNQFGTI
jgi:hypothetical protein